MQEIENLIIKNFELSDSDKQLLSSVCFNIKDTNRTSEIVKALIDFRLDFHSIIAYLAYESNYNFNENVDSDI